MTGLNLRRPKFPQWGNPLVGTSPNPFERIAHPPPIGEPLVICLHTRGLAGVSPEEHVLLGELAAQHRRKAVRVIRTPGAAGALWEHVPVCEIEQRPQEQSALVRIGTQVTWIDTPNDWNDVAASLLGSPGRQVELVDVAAGLKVADLVVAASSDLLATWKRSHSETFRILSPYEIWPLVGVWSRAAGHGYLLGPIDVGRMYSWVLTRALTPAAWPGFAALLATGGILSEGREVAALANSVMFRLDRLVRGLERATLLWLRDSQNGIDEEFDNAVLAACAIQDNLARLVGTFLGVRLGQPHEWGLLRPTWQRAVKKASGKFGRVLVGHIEERKSVLQLAHGFRQHAAHRELVGTRAFRIHVKGALLETTKKLLEESGENLAAWGITSDRGHWVRESSATIDPLPFCLRLAAQTFRLVNSVLEIVDPASDERLPSDRRDAARRAKPSRMERVDDILFSPEFERMAIVSSPLSGLVDWVKPVAELGSRALARS